MTSTFKIKHLIAIILSCFILLNSPLYGQGYDSERLIHEDADVKVYVQFRISKNLCDPTNSRKSLWRYKVIGKNKINKRFLVWEMNYLTCEKRVFKITNSFDLGDFEKNIISDRTAIIESLDFDFNGTEIVQYPYNIRLQNQASSIGTEEVLRSQPPDQINAAASVCYGQSTKLTLAGGLLQPGEKWIWYEESCNSKIIGEGPELLIRPTKQTTYFVKAVGNGNETECRSATVNVDLSYSSPDRISFEKSQICEGEQVNLSVSGGQISNSGKWVWYSEAGIEGSGGSINVSPNITKTYKVRGEGSCGNTNFVSAQILVTNKVPAPISIELSPATVHKNANISLLVNANSLPSNTEWIWYKDELGTKAIGKGQSIGQSFKTQTNIFVRAENTCFQGVAAERVIILDKKTTEQFYFFNAGTVTNDVSNTSGLLSNLSITLGYKRKLGYYIRGKFSLESSLDTKYNTTDTKIENYSIVDAYYKYNGKEKISRMGLTAGCLLGSNNFMIYVGGGYGQKNLYWGIDELALSGSGFVRSGWAKNTSRTIVGPEAEVGVLIRVAFINIMGGASGIFQTNSTTSASAYKNYIDAHFGIGINF